MSDARIPQNLEPNKCSWWAWKTWQEIDSCTKKFVPMMNLLHDYQDIEVRVNKMLA